MDVYRVAHAIAQAEGFEVQGSIPQRASNPGDLRLGDVGYGVLGEGITVFQYPADGWNRLFHQVGLMLSGKDPLWPASMTLLEAGLKYSGGDPNWPRNVAAALGVDESITLGELAGTGL